MTSKSEEKEEETCPVQGILKLLAGKWKPEIFRLAVNGSLRFSQLLREIPGSNKQTLSIALRELEELGILDRKVIQQKPLHVEYFLTQKGKDLVPIFQQLEGWS